MTGNPVLEAEATIAAVEAFVLRVPIETPVQTSFGMMRERPALLVRLTETGGRAGWGEIWCNFPACGAEHRARLVETVFAPLLQGLSFDDPALVTTTLEEKVHTLTVQSGEFGPFAQVLAGIDCALWDLAAQRAGVPLWKLLGGSGPAVVPAYASGINPVGAAESVATQRARGHRAFKVKIGFEDEQDVDVMRQAREAAGTAAMLMADANQGWTVERAERVCAALAEVDLTWIEEPLPADSPRRHWSDLRERITIPVAAGENVRGLVGFQVMIASGLFDVIQPDCAKWGGVTGCLAAARQALAQGRRYCPHFLGAGLGLAFSAHLLKAAGGDGLLEVDINENPLREEMAPWSFQPEDGHLRLPEGVGVGVVPDAALLRQFGQDPGL